MDIGDDFFKRHAHYIASTATFRPTARGSAPEASVTSRMARVVADAGVSDGVPADELDTRRGSGRS